MLTHNRKNPYEILAADASDPLSARSCDAESRFGRLFAHTIATSQRAGSVPLPGLCMCAWLFPLPARASLSSASLLLNAAPRAFNASQLAMSSRKAASAARHAAIDVAALLDPARMASALRTPSCAPATVLRATVVSCGPFSACKIRSASLPIRLEGGVRPLEAHLYVGALHMQHRQVAPRNNVGRIPIGERPLCQDGLPVLRVGSRRIPC